MFSSHLIVANGESFLPVMSPTAYTKINIASQKTQKPIMMNPKMTGIEIAEGTSPRNRAADLKIAIARRILLNKHLIMKINN